MAGKKYNILQDNSTTFTQPDNSTQYNENVSKFYNLIGFLCFSADFLMNLLCTFILPTAVCFLSYKLSLTIMSQFLGMKDAIFTLDQLFFIITESNLVYCSKKLLTGLLFFFSEQNNPVIFKERLDIIRCVCIILNELFNMVIILLKIKIILIIWNYNRRLTLDKTSLIPRPGTVNSSVGGMILRLMKFYFGITLSNSPVWLKQSIFILLSANLINYTNTGLFWQFGLLWGKFGIPDLLFLIYLIDLKVLRPVTNNLCHRNNIKLLYLVLVLLTLSLCVKNRILNSRNTSDYYSLMKTGYAAVWSGIFLISPLLYRFISSISSVLYEAIKFKFKVNKSFSKIFELARIKFKSLMKADGSRSNSEISKDYSENYSVEKFWFLYLLLVFFNNSVSCTDILFLVYSSSYAIPDLIKMKQNQIGPNTRLKVKSDKVIQYSSP